MQMKFIFAACLFSGIAWADVTVSTDSAPTLERPQEYPADFQESDFNAKPFLRDFQYVVVINKATEGRESQTARVYKDQKPITLEDVVEFESRLNATETDPAAIKERQGRIAELSKLMKDGNNTLFKVSSGRDGFEKEGEHHGQKDTWSVTPTGYFTIQDLDPKHKSDAYSENLCDSFGAKLFGFFTKKEYCTYMVNAMFFNNGVALHKAIPGTEKILGKKASGGCVRLPAALAEFLFLNFQATQNPKVTAVPVVAKDGQVKMDPSGQVQKMTMTSSIWGKKYVWSALVIVESKIVE